LLKDLNTLNIKANNEKQFTNYTSKQLEKMYRVQVQTKDFVKESSS